MAAPAAHPPRVCLNMIVRNEAAVLARCLASARPFIHSWCIVDTGSTDGTPALIRSVLADLPGELHERPWVDFGHNRSEALEAGRAWGDYLLFLDADDELAAPPGWQWPALTADCLELVIEHEALRHWRPALVATRKPWRWDGVLHETLVCDESFTRGRVEGLAVQIRGGGARSQVGARRKYLADAALLEEALRRQPDDPRTQFYLAQSWRDAGEPVRALAAYDRRATMGGYAEEAFLSRLMAARLAAGLRHPPAEVVHRFLEAHNHRPQRAEALGSLAAWCREAGDRWPLAYLFAREAAAISWPADDALFLEPAWYDWRCVDEWAIAAYWTGRHAESLALCDRLLASAQLPAEQRPRVVQNRAYAERALAR